MIFNTWDELKKELNSLNDKKIIFTNGCFDIIHSGHVSYLKKAKSLGDVLVLGLNSSESVKRLKGETRPVNSEEDRAIVLNELKSVDYVVIFNQDTPYDLVKHIKPFIIAKGGDYKVDDVVGKEITQKRNSKLDLNSLLIGNPDCTFLIKVTGDSMTKAGINTGDIILVDRSIKAKTGNIVVATINNKLLVKRLILNENGIELLSENDSFPNIKIKESDKFNIWGVVKSIIKQV
jgi:D-beta-D-heptose 7-phosphate kinase/D-beta-D-heptose 1-phosphate adenosyltransferase